ncbi:uncharacterized protein LOC111081830 [Drosophila obscura]|uniref:uncharacterized protein LOC111081830 n=1 Tax=Drosophila obscura TaxID=7282 RepID=UPI000BA178AF|nr:uncharacterized protein LOC111081830 [Drosophila obscura]
MANNLESRVVDLDVACLICLNEESGHISIYSHDLEPPHTLIADMIRCCTSLQLESLQMQRWPDKICEQCHSELAVAYRFYEKCVLIEKLFLTATNSSHSVDADELARNQQLKLYLEEHHVKLPASLKIKRVNVDADTPLASRTVGPVSATRLNAGESSSTTSTTAYGATANLPVIKVEYSQEGQENTDSLPQIPDESRSMVMSLDTLIETVPMKDQPGDTSDQECGKILIPSPWEYDNAPNHFYEITMEETVSPPPSPTPPPPPPSRAPNTIQRPNISKAKRRTANRNVRQRSAPTATISTPSTRT